MLHLPHASTFIPEDLRDDFLLSDQELLAELNRITDHATDVIFKQVFPEAKAIVFPVSRLVVDPERFSEDSQESMSQVEMGVTYTRESLRQLLRELPSKVKREELLEQYYIPHHQKLTEAVEESLLANGHCLIIDGHSFPSKVLPYELNAEAARPDFCLGTDDSILRRSWWEGSNLSCSASAIHQRVTNHSAEQSSHSSTIEKISESNH